MLTTGDTYKLDDNSQIYFDSSEKYTKLSKEHYNYLEINGNIFRNTGMLWEFVDNLEITFYIYK